MARPIQTRPDELLDDFMVPEHVKKMSKRDLARQNFVKNFRKNQAIKKSLRHQITVEMEKMKDFEEGVAGQKKMKYDELVEDMNRDRLAISQINRPLTLY